MYVCPHGVFLRTERTECVGISDFIFSCSFSKASQQPIKRVNFFNKRKMSERQMIKYNLS